MPDMPDYVRAVYTSVKNTWQDAENLDDTHGYTSYIWIPEETFKVDVMKLRVYSEKFRAHSKAALAGGAQVVTSEATTIDHTHNVVIGTKTSVAGGAHSHSVTGATTTYVQPMHTHDVAIGTKTSVAGGAHSHTVSGQTATSGGEHSHTANIFLTSTPTTSHVLTESEMPSHTHSAVAMGTDISGSTGADQGHTHNYDKTTDITIPQAGLHTHSVTGATSSTVTDHAHDVVIGTVTSASGGGSHAHGVSGQTAVAVTDHTHDVVIGTVTSAAGGGSHSHDVTLPDHTHPIDFGIYEEDIAGRTLSAVLYDPDGNLVKDFGVVTTGEDNVTIDLSEHFETLKYGFWRLVLTASARLRARLIFYELCKMYAQF